MPRRRTLLIGAGALFAGGAAILDTGAFTTVQAERTVEVETAGDSNALLTLDIVSGSANGAEYAEITGDGLLEVTISDVNLNAITHIDRVFQVTNNGTQPVVLYFEERPGSDNPDENAIDVGARTDQLKADSTGPSDQPTGNGIVDDDIADLSAPSSPNTGTGYADLGVKLDVGQTLEVGIYIDTSDDALTTGLNESGSSDVKADEFLMENLVIWADANAAENSTYQFVENNSSGGGGSGGGGGGGGNSFIDPPEYYDSGSPPNSQAGKPKYVERRGQYAFVVFQESPGYIVTYDVSDPTNPSVADTVNTAPTNQSMNGGYALSLNTDTLYVCQNGGSFTAVDVSDPTNMSLRSRVFTGGQGFDIATKGDHVYIADTGGALRVFDVSDPSNPSQVTTRSVTAGGVAVNNNELYVTDFPNDNLLIYDISSPATPSQIGSYSPTFSFPVPVDVAGGNVYVQEYLGTQIDIVDITDPTSPQKTDTISTPEQIPNGGAVRVTAGNLLLTTGSTGSGHITIYDITDFSSPIKEYAVPGGPNIETGDGEGNYVYLPNYTNDGLTIAKVK